jgi:hypothetical protein
MVDVAMCIEKELCGKTICRYEVGKFLSFSRIVAPGVHDNTFSGCVPQYIGVLLKGIEREGMNAHNLILRREGSKLR